MKSFLSYIIGVFRKHGIRWTLYNGFHGLIYFTYYKKIKKGSNTFLFQGSPYHYFYSFYNSTYYDERSVEIPIVMNVIKRREGKRILEIGNVLSHYFNFAHDVVDKYEVSEHVINIDVVEFKSAVKYDLIVSISTLEHVGWDDGPHDDTKILAAFENLKSLVKPKNGMILITVPLGYNPLMDKVLKEEMVHFSAKYYMKRISKGNEWKEVCMESVQDVKYGKPFPGANGLFIGIIKT